MEEIRLAVPADAPQLLKFPCANANQKWTRTVESLIRGDVAQAVADGDAEAIVYVAEVDKKVVGVIAVGRTVEGNLHIPALAVSPDWRRNGIALRLKQTVLDVHEGDIVVSEVHRRNNAMIGLNAKLNASTATNPEDGNYLLTVVLPPSRAERSD